MPVNYFHKLFKWIVGFLTLSFAVSSPPACTLVWAEEIGQSQKETAIYIDPGHGGKDTGARGANTLYEKNVVLALAKRMMTDWIGKGDLLLSRNDDYSVALFQRTESANNRKAHLFISLHAGSSFNHTAEGITVYYF